MLFQYREQEIVRLCMKHFRQRNYSSALQALQLETNVTLEDPMLAEFHKMLVENGEYEKAEKFLENTMISKFSICFIVAYGLKNVFLVGLFSEYIKNKDYHPVWEQIDAGDDSHPKPGMRGGHQMCIDPSSDTVYLFGGWDGNKDLNDLWSYDIKAKKWSLLCADASLQNGPSPRSCHKMCLDTKHGQIFLLGRYLDVQFRSNDTLQV